LEVVLWYLLASSHVIANRVRIIRLLDERSRTANELATDLDLDYKTTQHHLDVLMENNILRRTDNDPAAD
jgi:DNA-binding transcriptional ArsR family regulator